jgi:hypothetical protein
MKTPEEQAAATNAPAEETTNGVPQPPAPPAPPVPPMSKEEFEAKNKRRHELINKEFDGGGLSQEEQGELTRLEEETDRYIDAIVPLPFHLLEEIKESFRWEGIDVDKLDP